MSGTRCRAIGKEPAASKVCARGTEEEEASRFQTMRALYLAGREKWRIQQLPAVRSTRACGDEGWISIYAAKSTAKSDSQLPGRESRVD
jgi:hypothetical protein